jgi:cell division protein FtsL
VTARMQPATEPRQARKPAAPKKPPLKVVEAPAAPPSKRATVAVAALTITGLCLFGVVAAHVKLTQGQVRLDRLEARAAEAQDTYDRLRLQVAELESPERVVRAAHELGMVAPAKVTYLAPVPTDPATSKATTKQQKDTVPAATGWVTVKPLLGSR